MCAFVVITIVSENLHIKEIAISTKISKPFRQISPTNKSTHTKIRNHLRKKEREETRKHNVLRKYQINVNWQSPSKAWLQLLCTPNLVIKWDFCCCCYFPSRVSNEREKTRTLQELRSSNNAKHIERFKALPSQKCMSHFFFGLLCLCLNIYCKCINDCLTASGDESFSNMYI